jgi:tripartite-type tricarboxylate transporter receptor subunit TctC
MRRRALLLACAIAVAPSAHAADAPYPAQPVQIIMPFPPGGGADLVGRALAAGLTARLGQPFAVVTRDGAAGAVGFAALAQAKPDGYTLAASPATPMTNVPWLQKQLPYRFETFTPICQTFENVFTIAVRPESRYRVLKDLLDDARARPGQVLYGCAALGSVPHLSVEALAKGAGVRFTLVPYRGDTDVLPHLLSRELDFGALALVTLSGRDLRPLVVFNNTRNAAVPDVPAAGELGMPDIPPGLNGLFAPRGTPEPVLARLERGCAETVASAEFRDRLARLNGQIAYLDRAAFTQRLRADYELKGRLIREIGLAAQ